MWLYIVGMRWRNIQKYHLIIFDMVSEHCFWWLYKVFFRHFFLYNHVYWKLQRCSYGCINSYYVHHLDKLEHLLVPKKLNGSNYPTWSKSMTHALIAQCSVYRERNVMNNAVLWLHKWEGTELIEETTFGYSVNIWYLLVWIQWFYVEGGRYLSPFGEKKRKEKKERKKSLFSSLYIISYINENI